MSVGDDLGFTPFIADKVSGGPRRRREDSAMQSFGKVAVLFPAVLSCGDLIRIRFYLLGPTESTIIYLTLVKTFEAVTFLVSHHHSLSMNVRDVATPLIQRRRPSCSYGLIRELCPVDPKTYGGQ